MAVRHYMLQGILKYNITPLLSASFAMFFTCLFFLSTRGEIRMRFNIFSNSCMRNAITNQRMRLNAHLFINKRLNECKFFNNRNILLYFQHLIYILAIIHFTFALFLDGKRSFDDDVIWDDDSSSSTDDESDIPLAITDKIDCTTLVLK